MSYSTFQNKQYAQDAHAAKVQGTAFALHRPIAALNAIPNEIGNIKALLTAKESQFWNPSNYGNAIWYGVFDGRRTKPGDYFIGAEGTYFIASQPAGKKPLLVNCNHTITISSENLSNSSSIQLLPLMSGWPCSIIQASTHNNDIDSPESLGQGAFILLIPYFLNVFIQTGHTVINEIGDKYVVRIVELTDSGWRMRIGKVHR